MTSPAPRKPRCRVLNRKLNRCASEAVTEFGFCAHHLAAAAAEFKTITKTAPRRTRVPA